MCESPARREKRGQQPEMKTRLSFHAPSVVRVVIFVSRVSLDGLRKKERLLVVCKRQGQRNSFCRSLWPIAVPFHLAHERQNIQRTFPQKCPKFYASEKNLIFVSSPACLFQLEDGIKDQIELPDRPFSFGVTANKKSERLKEAHKKWRMLDEVSHILNCR